MSASTVPAAVRRPLDPTVRAWTSLVAAEALRFARHPLFLTGVVGTALSFGLLLPGEASNSDRLNAGISALFIGLVGMVVAYRRTASMRVSSDVVDSTPTSPVSRTAAVCAACLVPATAGLVAWLFTLWSLSRWPLPEWMYGGLSDADVVALTASQTVIASLGGPLLGVAAARWLRFRGAPIVLTLGVTVWVFGVGQSTLLAGHVQGWQTAVRMFSPFAFFQTLTTDSQAMQTFPGSPPWYAVWQLGLCGLAVVAALLKDSVGVARRRLLTAGVVTLVLAAAAYALAVTGGLPDILVTHADGTTSWGGR